MKSIWYELRMVLVVELLNWMIHVAPKEKDGFIVVKGAGNIAEALKLSFEHEKRCGRR